MKRKKHYDFLIVCGQRSGSHLLGTMLNSHPDICCRGEIWQARDKFLPVNVHPKPTQILGGILMYSKGKNGEEITAIETLENYIDCGRVIHLKRDPLEMARSRYVQVLMKMAEAGGAHSIRGNKRNKIEIEPLPDDELKRRAAVIEAQRMEVDGYLRAHEIKTMNVDYKRLTSGGQDVDSLNYHTAGQLLRFLQIKKYIPLVTDLQQTGYSEMVKNG